MIRKYIRDGVAISQVPNPNLDWITADNLAEALQIAEQEGISLRFVHWIRDPLKLIASSYFYTLHTKERWTQVPYLLDLKQLVNKWCGILHTAQDRPVFCGDQTVEEILARNESKSYHQILHSLRPNIGFALEAARLRVKLIGMAQIFDQTRRLENTITIDLESAMEAFDQTFRKIFQHLNFQNQGRCLQLAQRFDLSRPGSKGHPHAFNRSDVAASKLKQDLMDAMESSSWFRINIEPFWHLLGYA